MRWTFMARKILFIAFKIGNALGPEYRENVKSDFIPGLAVLGLFLGLNKPVSKECSMV